MTNTKIYAVLKEDPSLMDSLLEAKKAPPVRDGSDSEETKFIRSILGSSGTNEDISEVSDQIEKNPILQLFLQADGDIDSKELVDYVGDFEGEKANPSGNAAVRALLDGKLDIKEILMLIALFKLFKKKASSQQSSQQASSGGSLLNTLLGGSGSQPFGLAQPAQQPAQQQSQNVSNVANLITSLLGGSSGGAQPFGLAQPAQQQTTVQQPSSTSLFGNLFSSALSGSGNQPFGLAQPAQQPAQQQPQNNITSILNSLLSGNTGNNSQAQQLYSLLNNSSGSAVNNSGQVNVGQLFNIASQLLGGR